jgi:hypothetical protein
MFHRPSLAPLIGYLIVAAGTAIAAAISSNSSSKNAKTAANQANAANVVTNAQWGQEMQQKNYEFNQQEQQKKIEDFQSTLDRYPSLQKNMISIWGGGQ